MEIRKWVDRTIRTAGIAATISGGAFLYNQNQELGAQNRELKGQIDYLAKELYDTDAASCALGNFVGQITGMGELDCETSMQNEAGRMRQHGIELPKVKPQGQTY